MKSLRSDLEKSNFSIGLGNSSLNITALKDTDYFERLSKCYAIGGKRFGNTLKKQLK